MSVKTKTLATKKSKFLKFNLSLDQDLDDIIKTIDWFYPEFKSNNSAKIRFALGQLARSIKQQSISKDLDFWFDSLENIDKKEEDNLEDEQAEKWQKIKKQTI